jgi:translation initiation factor IF-3
MIRLRPNIDSHDLEVKLKNTRRHIEEGDKVRVFVMFRSRELSHPEIGRKLLEKMVEDLIDIAIIEKSIGMEGRQMSIMVAPKPKVLPVKPPKPPKEKVAKPAPESAVTE